VYEKEDNEVQSECCSGDLGRKMYSHLATAFDPSGTRPSVTVVRQSQLCY